MTSSSPPPADRKRERPSVATAPVAPDTASVPAPPYHHGALRDALIDAAEAVLHEAGPDQLTLREVARRAAVSHAAPYHHFRGLDDLLAAVAERGFNRFTDTLESAVRGLTPRAALVAMCRAYVGFAQAQPAMYRLMFGPLLSRKAEFPALEASAHRSLGVLMQQSARMDQTDALLLGLLGWSLSHGLSQLVIDRAFTELPMPVPPADELARLFAERLLDPKATPIPEKQPPTEPPAPA